MADDVGRRRLPAWAWVLTALLWAIAGAAVWLVYRWPHYIDLLSKPRQELVRYAPALAIPAFLLALLVHLVALAARNWDRVRRHWRWVVRGIALVFGIAQGILAWLASRLPAAHGSTFKLKHEIIRYGAAFTAVMFVIFFLIGLIPWVFDLAEGRSFRAFVAVRHVRASKSGFLTVISVLSILGVAVSSCALCGVTSVMGGFGSDLKRKILGNNAHITIDTRDIGGFKDWDGVRDRRRLVAGVASA